MTKASKILEQLGALDESYVAGHSYVVHHHEPHKNEHSFMVGHFDSKKGESFHEFKSRISKEKNIPLEHTYVTKTQNGPVIKG